MPRLVHVGETFDRFGERVGAVKGGLDLNIYPATPEFLVTSLMWGGAMKAIASPRGLKIFLNVSKNNPATES